MCDYMAGTGFVGGSFMLLYMLLSALLLIGLIILVYLWIIKMWKQMERKK